MQQTRSMPRKEYLILVLAILLVDGFALRLSQPDRGKSRLIRNVGKLHSAAPERIKSVNQTEEVPFHNLKSQTRNLTAPPTQHNDLHFSLVKDDPAHEEHQVSGVPLINSGQTLEERGSLERSNARQAVVTILFLTLLSLHNLWSRNAICYMVNFNVAPSPETARELINIDLNFNQTSYGMLASFWFALLYAVLGVGAGRAVDRCGAPRAAALGAAAAWSLATAALGRAQSLPGVALTRVAAGGAQALWGPAALGALRAACAADGAGGGGNGGGGGRAVFRGRQGLAHALFAAGAYLGAGAAALTPLLAAAAGWRRAAGLVGGAGLALVAVAAAAGRALRGPPPPPAGRAALPLSPPAGAPAEGGAEPPIHNLGAALAATLARPAVRWLLAASMFRWGAAHALAAWMPVHLRQTFPGRTRALAVAGALAVGVGGALSSLGGGVAADALAAGGVTQRVSRWAARCRAAVARPLRPPGPAALVWQQEGALAPAPGVRGGWGPGPGARGDQEAAAAAARARVWVAAAGAAAAAPLWAALLAARRLPAAMALLFLQNLAACCWLGPAQAQLAAAAPRGCRGVALGLFGVAQALGAAVPALVGAAAAPAPVGGGGHGWALARGVPFIYLVSAGLFLRAGEVAARELRRGQQGEESR